MNYGYERVSTAKQDNTRQEIQLNKLDIKFKKVYRDKKTGKIKDREELNKLLNIVKESDNIYVESISRFARNVDDLRQLCEKLKAKGITVHFIKEGFSTNGDGYKFLLTILGAVAELEREQIVDRVIQGVEKCKVTGQTKSGKWFGRPKKTNETLPKNFEKYYEQMNERKITKIEMAKLLGCGRATLYRWIKLYSCKK